MSMNHFRSLRRLVFLPLTWGLCSSALIALSGCQNGPQQGAVAPLEVSVVQVEPQDVVLYTDFVGSIDGIENAEIRARVAGYLEEAHFKEGTRVQAGDLLFTIDPVLSQAEVHRAQGDLARARAAASKAKADVDRLTPLVATNSVSRQELDHAVSAKEGAEAEILAAQGSLATAQASLDFTRVKSPIDGVVGVRAVSIGSLVGQGEPTLLTTVSQLDTVRVRFPISEQLYLKHASALNRLASGEGSEIRPRRLELILADGSIYPQRGWLALIDRAVSISTGSILLESRFPNPNGLLRPGQFARVRAATEKVDGALAVPQRAVMESQGMHQLFVLGADGAVERRAVTMGSKVGQYWLVNKGLKAGEKVLTEGIQKVKPGMKVVPKEIPLGVVSPPQEEPDAAAGTEPSDETGGTPISEKGDSGEPGGGEPDSGKAGRGKAGRGETGAEKPRAEPPKGTKKGGQDQPSHGPPAAAASVTKPRAAAPGEGN